MAELRCPNCGEDMIPGCSVYDQKELTLSLYKDGKGELQGLKGAVCPKCGQVSLYIPKPERFSKFINSKSTD